jgi:hypothetical protein
MPEPLTAACTPARIRAPTSLVPSPGTETMSPGPTRTASSGTRAGAPLAPGG